MGETGRFLCGIEFYGSNGDMCTYLDLISLSVKLDKEGKRGCKKSVEGWCKNGDRVYIYASMIVKDV